MNYPDFQIDWLRAFVAVVDAGSLSGAAPLVHRSQSAVSMQIKKLEVALGRPVLLRGPRHLEVTPAGAELLSYARRMLDLQAEAHAALFGPKLAGRVRLGVPDDYASAYLTPVLRSFSHRYQGVEIELTCEQSTSLIPRLGRGELDLALVSRDPSRVASVPGDTVIAADVSGEHRAGGRIAKRNSLPALRGACPFDAAFQHLLDCTDKMLA